MGTTQSDMADLIIQTMLAREYVQRTIRIGRRDYVVAPWGMNVTLGGSPILSRQRRVFADGQTAVLPSIYATGVAHTVLITVDLLNAIERRLATPEGRVVWDVDPARGLTRNGIVTLLPHMVADDMSTLVLDQRNAPDWRQRYEAYLKAKKEMGGVPMPAR